MSNATWQAEVLRAAGLSVVEHDGWKTRGRPGAFDPKGVMLHHTSSNPKGGVTAALSTVLNGRPHDNLPGPLSQLLLARDAVWHVIAAGRCNHAGKGKWRGLVTGNTSFIGVEAENNGVDEPWSNEMLESYSLGVAALLKHMGADASMACGHKEYALPHGRKVDPSFDMLAFRDRLENLLGDYLVPPVAVAPIPVADVTHAMLRKGAYSKSVLELQKLLTSLGYYKGKQDSDFGPATETAVKLFQKARGLKVDGKVGPKTWSALGI